MHNPTGKVSGGRPRMVPHTYFCIEDLHLAGGEHKYLEKVPQLRGTTFFGKVSWAIKNREKGVLRRRKTQQLSP